MKLRLSRVARPKIEILLRMMVQEKRLAISKRTRTPSAIPPMLLIISITAPVPCETGPAAGAAPPSAWNARSKVTVKIGIHLNIHGIRRIAALQVIVVVHSKPCISSALAASPVVRAMLRSDSPRHAGRVTRRKLRCYRSCHRRLRAWPEPADGRNGRGQIHPGGRAGAADGGQGVYGDCAARRR